MINDVFDYLLGLLGGGGLSLLLLQLTNQSRRINPLFIRLRCKHRKKYFRHISGPDALRFVIMSVAAITSLILHILKKLITRRLIVLVRLPLVQQLAAEINDVEEIREFYVVGVEGGAVIWGLVGLDCHPPHPLKHKFALPEAYFPAHKLDTFSGRAVVGLWTDGSYLGLRRDLLAATFGHNYAAGGKPTSPRVSLALLVCFELL